MPTTTLETHPRPTNSLGHFIIGAIPMAFGILIVWWHLLAPIVGHEHQGVLLWIASILCNFSLVFWLWCVVRFVEARFAKRNIAADQRAEDAAVLAAQRHDELMTQAARQHEEARALAVKQHADLLALVNKHCRSVQALHKRLETIEQRLDRPNPAVKELGNHIEERIDEVATEIGHLRELALEPIPNQRLGPRSLS